MGYAVLADKTQMDQMREQAHQKRLTLWVPVLL